MWLPLTVPHYGWGNSCWNTKIYLVSFARVNSGSFETCSGVLNTCLHAVPRMFSLPSPAPLRLHYGHLTAHCLCSCLYDF